MRSNCIYLSHQNTSSVYCYPFYDLLLCSCSSLHSALWPKWSWLNRMLPEETVLKFTMKLYRLKKFKQKMLIVYVLMCWRRKGVLKQRGWPFYLLIQNHNIVWWLILLLGGQLGQWNTWNPQEGKCVLEEGRTCYMSQTTWWFRRN